MLLPGVPLLLVGLGVGVRRGGLITHSGCCGVQWQWTVAECRALRSNAQTNPHDSWGLFQLQNIILPDIGIATGLHCSGVAMVQ